MKKEFDSWNSKKKEVDSIGKHKFYHTRDIWWCSLGVNVGFEQDGTGIVYERPVLVLKGFSKQVCLIVPLTTSLKKNPYHIFIDMVDNRPAAVIISQIRLIDTKRFINKVGVLKESKFDAIKKATKEFL